MGKVREYGIHSVKTEIKGLQSVLDNSINDIFEKVVDTILKTKGRVILSAVGKPGYIAHRVAATLASTGTLAYYVHANEASHGDMGMITKDDIVILLSKSGGSKEINDIIAYCKRFNIKLIGLTRNKESILAKSANIPVILESVEETNPLNAPTTSETMFSAYLNAVITALINVKHFDKDKYKIFHPGGKLGSSMLKVEEIMHKYDELPLVHENDNMQIVINTMIEKPLGCVGVLNDKDELVGIITDGDFKRKLIKYDNLLQKNISEIMTKNPIVIDKDAFALDAVKIMQEGVGENNNYIQVLFVVDKNTENSKQVVGLIHIQDCLRNGVI